MTLVTWAKMPRSWGTNRAHRCVKLFSLTNVHMLDTIIHLFRSDGSGIGIVITGWIHFAKWSECSLKLSESSLKLSECSLQSTECSLKPTESSLKSTECSLKLTECSLKSTECPLKLSECSLKLTVCSSVPPRIRRWSVAFFLEFISSKATKIIWEIIPAANVHNGELNLHLSAAAAAAEICWNNAYPNYL
jgi:hypothetical protein